MALHRGRFIKARNRFLQTSVLDIKGYDPSNPYAVAPDEELVTVAADEQPEYKTIPR